MQDKGVEAAAAAAAAAGEGEGRKEGAKRVGGERERSVQQASVCVAIEIDEVVGAEEERWWGKGRMTSEAAEVKVEEGAEEGEWKTKKEEIRLKDMRRKRRKRH